MVLPSLYFTIFQETYGKNKNANGSLAAYDHD